MKIEYIIKKKSTNKLAKEIGCSSSTICNYLKKYNIKLRTNKEAHTGILGANYIDGRSLKNFKCIDCDKKISYGAIRCHSCSVKGNLNPMSGKIGHLHPNWIENLNREYPLKFTNYLKLKIRKRDNYTCQGENCNITEEEYIIVYKRILCVHHIDYNKQNCNKDNLITLCQKCNIKANFNRNYWGEYFKLISENI